MIMADPRPPRGHTVVVDRRPRRIRGYRPDPGRRAGYHCRARRRAHPGRVGRRGQGPFDPPRRPAPRGGLPRRRGLGARDAPSGECLPRHPTHAAVLPRFRHLRRPHALRTVAPRARASRALLRLALPGLVLRPVRLVRCARPRVGPRGVAVAPGRVPPTGPSREQPVVHLRARRVRGARPRYPPGARSRPHRRGGRPVRAGGERGGVPRAVRLAGHGDQPRLLRRRRGPVAGRPARGRRARRAERLGDGRQHGRRLRGSDPRPEAARRHRRPRGAAGHLDGGAGRGGVVRRRARGHPGRARAAVARVPDARGLPHARPRHRAAREGRHPRGAGPGSRDARCRAHGRGRRGGRGREPGGLPRAARPARRVAVRAALARAPLTRGPRRSPPGRGRRTGGAPTPPRGWCAGRRAWSRAPRATRGCGAARRGRPR